MLEKVKYTDYVRGIDVEAYTDGYAYGPYSNVYLLSLAGNDSSVKAISSAVVSGKIIDILSEEPVYLEKNFGQKYRILNNRLGSSLLHQLVLADSFFNLEGDRLLYVGREEDAPQILYRAVRESCSVPMISEWSEWLYDRLKKEDGLEELRGTRKVLKLSIEERELESIVSEGVKSGEIRF